MIGKQKGRNIEIMNSFELVSNEMGDDIIIDREYYNMKEDQCELTILKTNVYWLKCSVWFLVKQVFSDMDFIGWYRTGDGVFSQDIKIHKQICEINEAPILLKLNPQDKNIDVSWVAYFIGAYRNALLFLAFTCELIRIRHRSHRWRSHNAFCSAYLHSSNGRSWTYRSRSCRTNVFNRRGREFIGCWTPHCSIQRHKNASLSR